jgi:hypothetical protein
MGDIFGSFLKGVKGGVRALFTPITSRKRPRPAEVVDEVVPDDRDGRPAKRRLAMDAEEFVRGRPLTLRPTPPSVCVLEQGWTPNALC